MPYSPESRARIAFVVFVALLAAGAVAWYAVVRGAHSFYEIRSHDNVSGLIRGAPVEFHGVEVGKVDEVRLVDAHSVHVVLEVDRQVPVTSATVATILGRGLATRGFTGYVYVSLEEGPGEHRPLVPPADGRYPVIASAPSRAVSMDTSISQLNDNVQSAIVLLRTTLDPQTIASLKQSVAHLDEVTRTLAANNARMQAIVVDARRATAQMPPLVQAGAQTLRTMQDELLPQTGRTLAQMNGVIAATQDTVTRLDQLTGSLAETTDRLRRNPAVLVRGTTARPGPGESP
jgi:phospholipid/cholesterol/gamma-HCH transport system substrate-binding protein